MRRLAVIVAFLWVTAVCAQEPTRSHISGMPSRQNAQGLTETALKNFEAVAKRFRNGYRRTWSLRRSILS